MNIQNLCILGATGSIGQSTFKVLDQHPERFTVRTLAASSNVEALLPLITKYRPEYVCLFSPEAAKRLRQHFPQLRVGSGLDGLVEAVTHPNVDTVINGLVGSIGCQPTLAAIQAGKKIGLANKETLVMAGDLVNATLKKFPQSKLLPIDSEHSAIMQCLSDRPPTEVDYLTLTASGGPFRTTPYSEFSKITREKALQHPTWSMGPKITIDSATLMNKGLEVIEAHHLFQMPYSQIQIVVHPTSTVHSMVQFKDGSLMAQLGCADMQVPILHALTYPEHWHLNVPRLNLAQLGKLEFFELEKEKFPCVGLAYWAGAEGGIYPAILNAANEIIVAAFLKDQLSFIDIPKFLERVLNKAEQVKNPNLETILAADQWARKITSELLSLNPIAL